MIKTLFTIIFFLAVTWLYKLNAQYFTDISATSGVSGNGGDNEYGSGVCFYDFDHDGWDDITMTTDSILKFFKNYNGIFTEFEIPSVENYKNVKSVNWVDYDNDGDCDLFISHYENPIRLYNNNGLFVFTDVTSAAGLPINNVRHFGSSWGDFNRDGNLDLYVCTYVFNVPPEQIEFDWYNHLYKNLGNGTFVDVSMDTGVWDHIRLSFQGLWTDVNNDLWPDLFVINDKSNPNGMYFNNGNGTFADISVLSGTQITNDDPMTATGGDFNNDGFEDLYTTNTLNKPCRLFENNGNMTYSNVSISSGVDVQKFTWGANFLDVENDMDQDLYVSEFHGFFVNETNYLFLNEDGSNFTENNIQDDIYNSYVNALGDYNNDGYPDIVVLNAASQDMNFWANGGGTNNWIKILPEGVVSNRDGVGTRIEIWSNGNYQSCYTHCGESYINQNSRTELFGLGTNEVVDSVILHWTSGIVDHYFNIPANNTYEMVEGGVVDVSIAYEGDAFLCNGEEVTLTTGVFSSYLWSTGDTLNSITVNEPGIYSVTVSNELGAEATSLPVEFFEVNFQQIEVSSGDISCFDANDGFAAVTGDMEDIESVVWNNETSGFELVDLGPGEYNYLITDVHNCTLSGSVTLSEPDSLFVEFDMVPVNCFGDSTGAIQMVITNAIEFEVLWNNEFVANDLNEIPAGIYSYVLTDSSECSIGGELLVPQADEILVELTSTDVLCYGDSTGTIVANASGGTGPLDIDYGGFDPFALGLGTYTITVNDSLLCSVDSNITIAEPAVLEFNWEYIGGYYNLDISGGTEPYNILWDNGDTTSVFWEPDCLILHEVQITDSNGCEISDFLYCLPVSEIDSKGWKIYPNPTSDFIQVVTPDGATISNCFILDTGGKLIASPTLKGLPENRIDVTGLSPGPYVLRFHSGEKVIFKTFVRQ